MKDQVKEKERVEDHQTNHQDIRNR